ncbi:DUF7948 domain-containing protein [Hymenobacter metallilatus]|uniref:PKD domain-containing protein n=1 Tax=Hymenobacter metallilatus TaxID=2493666 RepID=A0A3R9MA85_9BACT|nr:gliding motility-associated C-terminal domain-containing protein [Hymenobacter metallilatus]RSK37168.1 PKD domain-containing protein [Hymenobacter metallilatus]
MKQLYLFMGLWLALSIGAKGSPTGPEHHLEFIENKGQWPTPVLYAADVPGGRLFMEPGGLTYALTRGLEHPHTASPRPAAMPVPAGAHAVRVEFVGAAASARVQPAEATPDKRNYLQGSDPARWAAGVGSFRQLRYPAVWAGIGAHFYENDHQQLEYDFELAPLADPARIRLRYHGADAVKLTPEGQLEISTSVGTLRELAPRAWQTDAQGRRQPVSCAYVLRNQEVSFRLGAYDPHRALTIDPTVVFSTFTGSLADNWGFTATYDAQGNLYSGGIVFSTGYPASPGAYSTQFAGSTDIAIIKYNTTARGPGARVWATYLGGLGADFPQSMVVNSRGELLVLAATGSTNFPTTAGALDRSFNGGNAINPYFGYSPSNMPNGSDLAVVRFSADGSRLLAATYLGGIGNEGVLPSTIGFNLLRNYGDAFRGDILVDGQDNVYLASNTSSPDFPVRNNFLPYTAGLNGVVTKLTPGLDQVVWGSQLGGNQPDAAYSLQLDAAGRLYVAGGTTSPDFPLTAGTVQPAQRGDVDGFVTRISASGTVLERSALVGTTAYDQAYFVQLDQSGGVYLLGQTLGAYPTVGNRYGVAGGRQFIHKLNADLTATEFATTFGSGRPTIDLSPTAFLVDQCERIYVSGWGGGNNSGYGNGTVQGLPTTTNATQRSTDGNDFYLMQLSTGARALDYATFFGGSGQDHVDGGTSRFDPRGVVYHAVCGGCGGSSDWPVPPGAGYYSTVNNSTNCNNAAFKYNFETVNVVAGTDRNVCVASAPIPLQGSPAGGVWTGPGVTGSVGAGFFFTPTASLLGTQTLTYTVTGVGPCGGVSTLQLTVVPAPPIAFTAPAQTSFCLNPGVPTVVGLAATPAGGTFSGPGVSGAQFNAAVAGPGTHTLVYSVTTNGCQLQTTRTVTVTQAVVGAGLVTCTGAGPQALVGSPAGGVWSGPGVSGSAATGFVFTPTPALLGNRLLTYTVTAPGGCTSSAPMPVTVLATPTFTPPTLPAYCTTNAVPVALPPAASWSGNGIRGAAGPGFTFTPALAGAGTHTLTYRTGFGLCDYTGSITVQVSAPVAVSAGADTLLCPGSTQPFRLRAAVAGGTWSGLNVTPDGRFTPPAGFTGSVTLTYTLPDVCQSTGTRRVAVAAPPATAPTWTPASCPENRLAPLTLTFSGGATTSSWEFGDGSAPAVGSSVTHTFAQAGTYRPRVTTFFNAGRCSQTATLPAVEVIPQQLPPNIITPNGDDKNEFFVIRTACPGQLQVFSRWGNKVFEATAYRNDWRADGLPDGVYYYMLRLPDGAPIKGWLTVQR